MAAPGLSSQDDIRRPTRVRASIIAHFKRDRVALIAFVVVVFYAVVALLCAFGALFPDYHVGSENPEEWSQPPTDDHLAGTDLHGRDVLSRAVHGARISLTVGFLVAAIAIPMGTILGAVAGYFGGLVDELIMWLHATVSSIPQILLIISISVVVGRGLTGVYLALGLTFWVGTCRVLRGEFIKHKERDYVTAAKAMGASPFRVILVHIVPNVAHVILINFSLLFIGAIKSEVIVSYLGIGIVAEPSWGVMIADSRQKLGSGVWWELTAASLAMFILVLALNIVADAMRDALDPKFSPQ